MRRFAVAVAALLLAAAGPVARDVASLRALPHPETADFYALKSAMGAKAFRDLQGQLRHSPIEPVRARSTSPRCPTEAEAELQAGVLLAEVSTSPEAFVADRNAAHAAWILAKDARKPLWAGEPPASPYRSVTRSLRLVKAAKTPRQAELFRRVAEDQFERGAFTVTHARVAWGAGLSENAAEYVRGLIAPQLCETDRRNTLWLKDEIARGGWFKISTDGAAADDSAWLLVQHADQDRAFQRQVLSLLEDLVARNESNPSNYAYLFDRLASAEGRPQRYGTQGRCSGPGIWAPDPVEDADKLDVRRAGVGLETEAEYRTQFREMCA